MALLIEAAGPRAGTAAVAVVAVLVAAVVVAVVAVAVAAAVAVGSSVAVVVVAAVGRSAVVAVTGAAGSSAAVAVTAGHEADTADAPSNHSHGRMAAVSGAAPAILYRLLPAPPGGAGRIRI